MLVEKGKSHLVSGITHSVPDGTAGGIVPDIFSTNILCLRHRGGIFFRTRLDFALCRCFRGIVPDIFFYQYIVPAAQG
jgi:hypothetical protein